MNHFKDYIPKAFPHGNDLILDSEVLMVDTKTSKPLPFGTLGVHKVMKMIRSIDRLMFLVVFRLSMKSGVLGIELKTFFQIGQIYFFISLEMH